MNYEIVFRRLAIIGISSFLIGMSAVASGVFLSSRRSHNQERLENIVKKEILYKDTIADNIVYSGFILAGMGYMSCLAAVVYSIKHKKSN